MDDLEAITKMPMKNPSPRRPLRQQSPRRFNRKSFVTPEDEILGGYDREREIRDLRDARERDYRDMPRGRTQIEGLQNKNYDLLLDDKTVERIMGPDPMPIVDVEYNEIQNELQKKLVEEIQCYGCSQFPFMPLECRSCFKIFCLSCQNQMSKNSPQVGRQYDDEDLIERLIEEDGMKLERSPTARRNQRTEWLNRKNTDGQMNRDKFNFYRQNNNNNEFQCPHCKAKGDDLLQEVNPVVRNMVDFCEFPHKCDKTPNGEVRWMTVTALQKHSQYDECPKYGCDICYLQEFQHMTRAQLRDHIKKHCPEVQIQCDICGKSFKRGEFGQHLCLRDYYMKLLKKNNMEVVEFLAEKMMKFKRQTKSIGLCKKTECLARYRESGKQKYESMMIAKVLSKPTKCGNCANTQHQNEEGFFCSYCSECYCQNCMGYNLQYDMQEMEDLLNKMN